MFVSVTSLQGIRERERESGGVEGGGGGWCRETCVKERDIEKQGEREGA